MRGDDTLPDDKFGRQKARTECKKRFAAWNLKIADYYREGSEANRREGHQPLLREGVDLLKEVLETGHTELLESSPLWKGQEGRLEESNLQRRDLYVLATLMEKKGQPVSNATLAGGQTAKVIGRLRKAIGDTAKKQEVICTADKEHWLAGWTGYMMRPELKVCLVRHRQHGGRGGGAQLRAS